MQGNQARAWALQRQSKGLQMADDPYAALGVSKTATEAELKKAYRRIAKADHPDLTDDPAAHDRSRRPRRPMTC